MIVPKLAENAMLTVTVSPCETATDPNENVVSPAAAVLALAIGVPLTESVRFAVRTPRP
jgi:hypothetical protein